MSAPEPILPAYIDSSMLTTFRACPMKFYHEYVLGLRAGKSIDLHAGAVFAACLERIYRRVWEGLDVNAALGDVELFFERIWGDPDIPLDDKGRPTTNKTKDRIWDALEQYVHRWGVATDHVQPYVDADGHPTFEHSFAIPLDLGTTGIEWPTHPGTGEPFIFAGRYDLLGHLDGVPVIRDEKTTTSIGAAWAKKWDMRGQFLGYIYAMALQGITIQDVIVRGVGILKTSITLVELHKTYPRHLVDRWVTQTVRDLRRIVAAWHEGYWEMDFGDACTAYNRCPYTTLCTASDPTPWMAEYEVERWNPLERTDFSNA